MRFTLRSVFTISLLFVGAFTTAQSKKDIIAAQSSVMDSMERVMDKQQAMIVKAADEIGRFKDRLEASDLALSHARERFDSLRIASGAACTKLTREKDDLVNQRRISSGRLQRTGVDMQRITCTTPFSIQGLSDTLSLEFAGPDLLSSVITFRVIDWRGDEIYRTPIELLRPEELTVDEALQRCDMQSRILAFFQDRRFSFPPIDPLRDADHTNKAASGSRYSIDQPTWEALRLDAYTSAFTFPIGATESRTIAYSRKLNKVVYLNALQP